MTLTNFAHRFKYFFKQSFYYLFAFWVILVLSLGWQGIESLLRAMIPSAAASNYTYIEDFSTYAQKGDGTTGSWMGDGIATVGRGQEFNWTNIHLPDATGRMFFSPTYDSTACANTPSAVCTYAILRTNQPPVWTPDNGQNFYEMLPPSLVAQSYLTESFGIDMAYSPGFATDGNVFIVISGSMLVGGTSELYQAELDVATGDADFQSSSILNSGNGSVQGVAVSPHLDLASCPSATTGACVIYAAQNTQGIVRLTWDGVSWAAQTISGPDAGYNNPSDQPDRRTLGSILLAVEDPDDENSHIVYYTADATNGDDTMSVYKLTNALLDPDSEGPDPYEICGGDTACTVIALPALTGAKDIADGVTAKPLGIIEGSIVLSPDYATNRTIYWATSTSGDDEGVWLGGMARYVDSGSSNWETVFSLNDVSTATGGRNPYSLSSAGILKGLSSDKIVVSYAVANLDGSDAQWPYGNSATHTLFSVSDDAGMTWSSPASLAGSGISANEINWATFGSMSVVPGGANAWSEIYVYDMFMNQMYYSADGAASWSRVENIRAPARVLDVQGNAHSGAVFVTYSGNNQVYRSRDFGQTFARLPPAGQVFDFADCSAANGDQLGFSPKWGVWTHIDPSQSFATDNTVYANVINGYADVFYQGNISGEINTCTGSRLIKSEDGGDTWELILNPAEVATHVNDIGGGGYGVPVPFAGFSDIALTQYYDGNASVCEDTLACTLFGLVSGISVWRSDNHGATWTEILDPDAIIAFGDGFVENGNVFTAIRLAPRFTDDTGVIVLTTLASTGIVYSADGGENFHAIVPGDVGLSSIDSAGFPSDFDNANAGSGGCDEGDGEFQGSCDVLLGGIGESGETSIVKLDNGFFDASGDIGFSPANPAPVQQGDLLGPPSIMLGDHNSTFFAGVGKIDSWAYPPFAAPTISFSSASNTSRFFQVDPVNGDISSRDDGGDDGAALPSAGDHITTGIMLGGTVDSGIILGANGLWRSYVYDVVDGTEVVSKNLSVAASNIRRVTLTPTQYIPAGASISYALSNNSCEIDSDDFTSDFEGGAGTYTGPIGEPGEYVESDPITVIFPRGGSGLCFKIVFSGMASDGPMPAVTQIAFEYGNTPPLTPQGASFNSENRTLAVTTVEDNDRGDKYWLQFEIRPMSGGRVTRFDQSVSSYGWGSASYQTSSYAGDPPVAGEPATFTLPDAYVFSPGAQYEWRVRAKDVGGAFSPYTPWADFTANDGFTEDFTSLSNLSMNQALYDGVQPLRIDTTLGVAEFNDSVSFDATVDISGLGGGDVIRMIPVDPNVDGKMDVVVVRSNPQNHGTEFHGSHTILYTNTTTGGTVSFEPELDLTYEIFQSGYEQGLNAPTAFFQIAGKDVVGGIIIDGTIAGFGLERADDGSVEIGQITPLPYICGGTRFDGFAVGYIDGDGVYDVVATCGDAGNIVLYSSEKVYTTGNLAAMIEVVDEDIAVAAIELLDVDGDNDTDIVVLTHEDNTVNSGIVYQNDGSGNFESTPFNLSSGISNIVSLQESAVFSSYGVKALSYTSTDASAGFLIITQDNNGDLSVLQQPFGQTMTVGANVNGVCGLVEADFGGDGDTDFVVVAGTNIGSPYCQGSDVVAGAMLMTNELQVQEANLYTVIPGIATNPSFADAEDVPKNISSVLAFDIDGDGRKDILVAEYGESIGLYAQTENSTFVSDDIENHGAFAQSTVPFALWGYSTYPGAMHSASQVLQSLGSVNGYQNTGSGFFSRDIELPDFDPQYANEDFKVALPVDINKDGYLDYYLFSFPPNDPTTPVIALSDGAEGFTYHSLTISVAAPFPVVGDINGDGLIDVVYTAGFECDSSGACGAEVFYGEQNGFSEASEFEVYIKGGNQNGDQLNFEDRATTGIGLRGSQLIDVDGDGDLDVVVFMDKPSIAGESGEWWKLAPYNWESDRGYAVFKNRGNGVFDAFMSLVDDNALNSSSALADGASGFNEAETACPNNVYPDVVQASTLVAHDMDGDGDYDIVGNTEANVGCSPDASVPFVAWNRGNGVFDVMKLFWSVEGDMPSGSIKVFDMDGDGYPDIVYSLEPADNNGSMDIWIGWNTGKRSFSLQRIDTGFPSTMLAGGFVADIDGDGDGDMVFADSDPEDPQHQVLRFSASHAVTRELRVVSKAFSTENSSAISALTLRVWQLVMPDRADVLSVKVSTVDGGDDPDAYEWVDPEEDGITCSEIMNYCDYVFEIPSSKRGNAVVWNITFNTEVSGGQSPVIYRVDVPQYSVESSGGGGTVTIAPLQVSVSPSMAHVGSSTRAHELVWKITSTRSLNAGQQRVILLDEEGNPVDYEWVGAESCSPQDGELVCTSYVKEVSINGRIKPDNLYKRMVRVEVDMGAGEVAVLAESSLSEALRSLADPVVVVMDSAPRERPLRVRTDRGENGEGVSYAVFIGGNTEKSGWLTLSGKIIPAQLCSHESRECDIPKEAIVDTGELGSVPFYVLNDPDWSYEVTVVAINQDTIISVGDPARIPALNGPVLEVRKSAHSLAFVGATVQKMARMMGAMIIPTAHASPESGVASASSQGSVMAMVYDFTQTLRVMSALTVPLIVLGVLLVIGAVYLVLQMHEGKKRTLKVFLEEFLGLLRYGAQKSFEHSVPRGISGTFKFAYSDYKRRHDRLRLSIQAFASVVLAKILTLALLAVMGHVLPHGALASPQVVSSVVQGDSVRYVIEVRNTGNKTASGVMLTDTIPDGALYVSGTATAKINDQVETTVTNNGEGQSLLFDVGDIEPGQTVFVAYTVKVREDALGDLTNEVRVAYGEQAATTKNTIAARPNIKNPIIPPEPPVTPPPTQPGQPPANNNSGAGSSNQDTENTQKVVINDVKISYNADNVLLTINGSTPEVGGTIEFVIMPQSSVFNLIPTAHASDARFPMVITYTPQALQWEFTAEAVLSRGGYQMFAYLIKPSGDRSPASTAKNFRVEYMSSAQALADNFSTLASFSPRELVASPQVQRVNQSYIAPLLFAVAILNASWAVNIYNLLSLFQQLITQPALLLERRKRKGWGVVYNALTKLPVDLAVVRLHDAKTGKLLQTRVTDKQGRYAFLVEAGEYRILVTKTGFKFPSLFARGKSMDVDFIDIYQGKDIIAPAPMTIALNIPFDPEERVEEPREVLMRVELRRLQSAFSVFGMVCALGSFIISPNIFVGGLLMGHVLLYGVFRRLAITKQPKSWGSVIDAKTKSPLTQSIVRIFDTQFNKLLDTQITDTRGRYGFLVGKNAYYVTYEHQGYEKERGPVIDLSHSRGNNEIVAEDIALKRLKS